MSKRFPFTSLYTFLFWLGNFKTFVLYICVICPTTFHVYINLGSTLMIYLYQYLSLNSELNYINLWIIWLKMSTYFVFLIFFMGREKGRDRWTTVFFHWCVVTVLVLVLYYRTVILIFTYLIFVPWFSLILIFKLKVLGLK